MTFGIGNAQTKSGLRSGIDLGGGDQLGEQLFDVEHADVPGDRHEGQQAGHDQKQQVVTGVDGGESEQQGDDDVEGARRADL